MLKKHVIKIAVFLCFMLSLLSQSYAAWPPAGSLLEQNVHPRLWFIPQSYRNSHPSATGITVAEMGSKLSTDYSSEFQNFINTMDSVYSDTISTKAKNYLSNDAINYAFLYMLDPANMTGFTAAHTASEYAAKAKSHWDILAVNVKTETLTAGSLTAWLDTRYVYSSDKNKGGHINLALAAVYDWLGGLNGSYFDAADVSVMLGAMDNGYSKSLSILDGKRPFLNNVSTGALHNAYYIALALYGDTVDADLTARFSEVEDRLLKAIRDSGNLVFMGGSNWGEGLDLYSFESFIHVALLYGGLGPAINEDLFETTKFLKDSAYFYYYNIVPSIINGERNWGHFDDDDPDVNVKSGSNWRDKTFYLLGGMLQKNNPVGASLYKWLNNESGWISNYSFDKRKEYVFFYFFSGLNHITSQSPSSLGLPLSEQVGEEFVFKSDLTNDNSTHIMFWAPEFFYLEGGHNHSDFAGFQIHKYGNLAIQRSAAKGYSGGNIRATKRSMFYNTIGVYKSGETHSGSYNLMSYRGGYDETYILPTDPPYLVGGTNNVGSLKASELNGSDYDYVNYEYSKAWDSSKVSFANREFIYLRSQGGTDDEYVVVFDRVTAEDPSYTKHFLLHSSFEPTLLDNSDNGITMSAQNYPNDPDTGGGRWVNTSSSPTKNNVIEITNTYSGGGVHGRLYNKTLLPLNFQVNKTGGPGHYWEDAEGKLIHTKTLTEEEKYYRGTYTTQIQSTTGLASDNFLNVMQFGDSNTLSSMNPTSRIDGDTMVGTLINDPTVPRVVMFSKDSQGGPVDSVTYSANYSSSLNGKHLLVDVVPGVYDIYKNGNVILSDVTASSQGVLFFSTTGGSSFQIVKTGSAPPPIDLSPPSPPTGLRIL